jgi:galactokinase
MNISFKDEPDLSKRITEQKKRFEKIFHTPPQVISRAPGRAEILGCHTDYNNGFALAAGISRSIIGLFSKRTDGNIRISSSAYPAKPMEFPLSHFKRDEKLVWTNYGRAVVRELINAKQPIGGANILINSTVPKSGGVSSSAALELAIAYGLLALYSQKIDPLAVAALCRKAENSDLVKSPCGFLDQGTVSMARSGTMVLFDFLPKGNSPVSKVETIKANLTKDNVSFVIPVDLTLERQLGASGYVVRRKMCEDSLPFWESVLHHPVKSLRDVTKEDFLKYRDILQKKNPVMRKRVEHIIFENERVHEAVRALEKGDTFTFGTLLTEAGESSLELYELNENTPQLTLLVKYGRTLPGVLGMRNMGGGFSAIALALVQNNKMKSFQNALAEEYKKNFHRTLEFIEFSPAQGAQILYSHI